MKRWLIILGILLALLVTMPLLALRSETLTRWVLPELLRFVPGKIELQHDGGALAGPLRLRDLRWEDNGMALVIERIEFDWMPTALLVGDVDVLLLDIGKTRLELPPPDDKDREPFDPRAFIKALDLPLDISIDRLAIEKFSLAGSPGISGVSLESTDIVLGDEGVQLGHTSLRRGDDTLQLDAKVDLAEPHATTLTLQVNMALEGAAPLDLAVEATGSLDELQLEARMKSPADASLDALLLELLESPHWRGRLEIAEATAERIPAMQGVKRATAALEFSGDASATELRGNTELSLDATKLSLEPTLVIRPDGLESQASRIQADMFDLDSLLDARVDWRQGLAYSGQLQVLRMVLPVQKDSESTWQVDDGRIDFDGDADGVNADAGLPLAGGKLEADAAVRFEDGNIDATTSWQDLALRLGERQLLLEQGKASFNGRPGDYRFGIDASLVSDKLPAGHIVIDGTGNRDRLQAEISEWEWLDGKGEGKVRLDIGEQQLDWSLAARDLRPGLLYPAVQGRAGLVVRGRSRLAATGPHEITLESLDGELNGNDLAGEGRLRIADRDLLVESLSIEAGDAQVLANGRNTGAGLSIEVDIPDVGELDARYSGALTGRANWTLADTGHSIQLEAEGSDILLPEFRATRAELDLDIVAGGNRASRVQVILDDARIAGAGISSGRADVTGTRDDNRIDLSLAATDGQVQLQASGSWMDDGWLGRLEGIELGARNAGAWSLSRGSQQPVAVTFLPGNMNIERFCLGREVARLCARASLNDGSWQADVDLEQARLEYFGELLPAGLAYEGGFELHAEARNRPALVASAELRLDPGSARARGGSDDDAPAGVLLEWKSGSAMASLDTRRVDTSLNLDLGSTGKIDGGGWIELPKNETGATRMNIDLAASLEELDLLAALYPEVNRIKGRIAADLKLRGSTDEPRLEGNAWLEDGSLQLARYGLEIEDIQLRLQGRGDSVRLDAGMRSGEGELRADLQLSERDERLQASGSISGERFLATNTRELRLEVSPDIKLEADGSEIDITGDILVPLARIRPRELSTGSVSASDDQVFVDSDGNVAARSERLLVSARLRTRLGEKVDFRGFGLESGIKGELTVIREPESPARGEGRLSLQGGKYRAYGQDLELVRGELIYSGQALSEPGLDIRAVRRPAPDVTVGVDLRGDLRNPKLSLFSEPTMPQQDQLSWLVLGRPATTSDSDQQQLDSATLALGISGGAITSELRDSLDLEEATLQDLGNRDEASLVLGKYLSPDLYVSYGIGLFEAANSFRIRYRLSSKWTLEAVSGLESSADFLYTIETGR